MHVTRQAFITSCSNIILTYLLIYSVVDLVWLPDLDLSGFLPRRGGVRPAWMGWEKCSLPLMHGDQSITTQRHDGIYFVVVVRLVNAHSNKLKFIIFRQLIANAYPEPIN